MLTSGMNADEILREFARAKPKLDAFVKREGMRIRRWCIKNHKAGGATSSYHETDGTPYVHVITYKKKARGVRETFSGMIKETREWMHPINNGRGVCSRSVHFYRRYAERVLHDKEMPVQQVMMRMDMDGAAHVLVYYDKHTRRYAFAMSMGLSLGYIDKRGIYMDKTFVSRDMLHGTQRKAFDRVWASITALDDAARGRTMAVDDFNVKMTARDVVLSSEEANEIYRQYFENKDNDSEFGL